MATTFSRTTRALAADGVERWAVALGLVVAVLLAWTVWLVGGTVGRVELSRDARIEVDQAVRTIEPVVDGRIVATHLALGREVAPNDVLLELDATPQTLERAEATSRLDGIGPESARLREEIAAETQALEQSTAAAGTAVEQARAQSREAAAAAENARKDAERLKSLHAQGIIGDAEYERSASEAQRRIAAADAQALGVGRISGEEQTRQSERRAHIESLQRQLTRLDGDAATLRATIDRLANEIERRKLRAVVGGTLADVAPVDVGAIVTAGQRLGTIVPAGTLKVVAHFEPSEALGRVREGQLARVRLDGFPWMQYGSVAATVAHVAGEVRDGLVRVDLTIAPDTKSAIPLQHGLTGVAEIEVERLSPAVLALRSAGQMMTRPVTSARERTP